MGIGPRRLEVLVAMRLGGGATETWRWFRRLSTRWFIWILALVSALSLWVFRPVLANGFVDWDDQIYLAELIRMGRFSLSSLRWMWTSLQPFYLQPIVWMTHLADYQLWGLQPMGHHATNWMLHGVYVALVGTLVWILTGKAGRMRLRERLAMSLGVALVCGIHPLQVESVAWVAARNGLLCSVWMVAALCAYVRAVGTGMNRRWWWATAALQAIALLTKPFAVSLPVVMFAMDFFPLRRNVSRNWWRLVQEKWLMIAMSVAAAVGAISAPEHLEGLHEYTLGARVLVAARGIVFYLWKLAWPSWLSPFYPLSNNVSLRNIEFLVPVLVCVAVTLIAVWQWKRAPVLLAAWGSYLALLLPVSGVVQVGGQAVADRYAYLAMTPILLIFGSGALWVWRRWGMAMGIMLGVVVAAWLMFLGVRTREQITVWHDDFTLWGAALAHFPNDPLANYNLALALLRAERLTEARVAAERAVANSDPHTPQLPMARGTLGAIYLATHDYGPAVEQLQQAIAADPTLWASRYNLACAYTRMGRLAEGYEVLQVVLAAQPEYVSLAARDVRLAALRNDPKYAARFSALVDGGKR
jgi:protein O-mannosyl-transferase